MCKLQIICICILLIFTEMIEMRHRTPIRRGMYMNQDGSCECGRINLSSPDEKLRIINGETVNPPYKYPWMVAIFNEEDFGCTGALISPTVVLTAAHCFASGVISEVLDANYKMCIVNGEEGPCGYPASYFSVSFVGESHRLGKRYPIKKYLIYPNFNFGAMENDTALIFLRRPVPCTKYTRPICLPPNFLDKIVGRKAVTAGWGKQTEGLGDDCFGEVQDLMESTLKIMNIPQCKKWSEGKKSHICAKGDNQGACKGDSGGPLFVIINGVSYIIGVVSHHYSLTCEVKYPQFFTNIRKFLPWILKNMKGAMY